MGSTSAFEDVEGLARVATLDEVRAQRDNLSIPLYVPPMSGNGGEAGEKPLGAVIAGWEQSSRALRAVMLRLFEKSKPDTGEEY